MGEVLMYLIDTNILIYYFNKDIPEGSRSKVVKILKENFNISVVTKMEFLGFKQHTEGSFRKAKKLIEYAEVAELEEEIVDAVIALKRNKNIKLPDAIIAATAMLNQWTLVTRNEKDFTNIDIKIYNPFLS
ncbi:MAG: type II toxin-antitoxin system VapC family toxin [Candidatus Aminicenantes bacterium]|nr:type II toxin-antitoxin system VapC family toxin [Candidatus Aminicenantes bacterium]